jgi:hypothetical protein
MQQPFLATKVGHLSDSWTWFHEFYDVYNVHIQCKAETRSIAQGFETGSLNVDVRSFLNVGG